jgi:hypothetical protein
MQTKGRNLDIVDLFGRTSGKARILPNRNWHLRAAHQGDQNLTVPKNGGTRCVNQGLMPLLNDMLLVLLCRALRVRQLAASNRGLP